MNFMGLGYGMTSKVKDAQDESGGEIVVKTLGGKHFHNRISRFDEEQEALERLERLLDVHDRILHKPKRLISDKSKIKLQQREEKRLQCLGYSDRELRRFSEVRNEIKSNRRIDYF